MDEQKQPMDGAHSPIVPAVPTQQKKAALNIIAATKHRGFGSGAIDLRNVTAVIIEGEEAMIDIGALHAKSRVEKGIRFSPDPNAAPDGETCWLVWIASDRTEDGQSCYAGAAACVMRIDRVQKQGWKVLADHVNRMDAAMKRRVLIDELPVAQKRALQKCLIEHNEALWTHATEVFRRAFD
jgi:hypothetical protein